MKVMGIDPSLRGTGICVMGRHKTVLEKFVIKTKRGKKTVQRKETAAEKLADRLPNLFQINKTVREVLEKYKPNVVAIEGYSFGSKIALPLQGEVVGAISLALFEISGYKPVIIIIPPTSVKKFVTGKGSGKKELVLKEVYRRFDFDTENNNIADAYVLCMMAWHVFYFLVNSKFARELSKDQRTALMKIQAVREILKGKKKHGEV